MTASLCEDLFGTQRLSMYVHLLKGQEHVMWEWIVGDNGVRCKRWKIAATLEELQAHERIKAMRSKVQAELRLQDGSASLLKVSMSSWRTRCPTTAWRPDPDDAHTSVP